VDDASSRTAARLVCPPPRINRYLRATALCHFRREGRGLNIGLAHIKKVRPFASKDLAGYAESCR
jgi:hypothetical protein